MRRHGVFFFIFVFWSLVVCTILSTKIEEQMTAEVVIKKSASYSLPMDVLFQDETGEHLYNVVKGEGFEKGKRVSEVKYGNYWLNEDSVGVSLEELDYIRYATKEISVGDLVTVTQLYEGDSETYLVIDSQESSIVYVENALHPFIPEAIKISLDMPEESTIYNLGDVRTFAKNIPLLGGIFTILLASTALWLHARRSNKIVLALNTAICGGLFWGFYMLVQKLEFPDSLLPHESILEFGYYKHNFTEIFRVLEQADLTLFNEMKGLYMRSISYSLIILVIGGLICFMVIRGFKNVIKEVRDL